MIELINHLPDNVVGIVTRGRVTREECDDVLRPAMDASARRHGKVRLYYEIGSRYPGAGWDELDIGASRLERIALVSDAAWMRWIVNALRPAIACEVRVFSMDEAEEGLAWLAASGEEARAMLDVPRSSPQPPRARPPLPPRSRRSASRRARAGSRQYPRRAPDDRQVH
jgi:hypothetical protein